MPNVAPLEADVTPIIARLVQALEALRARKPLVHCITNAVTINDVANGLLALGARPVMASLYEEIPAITRQAQALYLNLGTPDRERVEAIRLAASVAHDQGIPIVLDPVGVGASHLRLDLALELMARFTPTVMRGNRAEIAALVTATARQVAALDDGAGDQPTPQQSGVDALGAEDSGRGLAEALARSTPGCAVAVSGKRDWVSVLETHNGRLATVAVDNGHAWLERISGAGCVVTALMAAFAATKCSPFVAALAGFVSYGTAAERAALVAGGPGSLRPLLLDALYTLDGAALEQAAQLWIASAPLEPARHA